MCPILRSFAPDLWIAEGLLLNFIAGFAFPTRMAAIRLADGGLFVWSPVALNEALKAEIDALGRVARLVSAGQIDQVLPHGSFVMTEAVFFHRADKTANFADLIQKFPPGWFKEWRGILARLDGIVAADYGAPREWRASFLRRRMARDSLGLILDWPIEKVFIAHGDCAEKDGAVFVRRAFSWLI